MSEAGEDDPISPRHYAELSPQPIDAIEGWGLGFCLGNALKYIARAGRKPGANDVEDLEKALWYLAREIAGRKAKKGGDAC